MKTIKIIKIIRLLKPMNRQGEEEFEVASKSIFWLVLGFLILALVFGFWLLIGSYESKLMDVPAELKAEVISLRFTNIPSCFAYQDISSGRVFTGSIDLRKFTPEQMNKCYATDDAEGIHDFNFRLSLKSKATTDISTNNYKAVDSFSLSQKVLVWDGTQFTPDELTIYVQVKI